MGYINQLLNFLKSPIGLAGLVFGLILWLQANRSRRVAWLLFSLFCFAASLAKYQDEFIPEAPPLVFPLQQLRDMGRPLTIVLLGLLLLLILSQHRRKVGPSVPMAVTMLIVVQIVIFLKTLYYGDPLFAAMAAAVFGSVVVVVMSGPGQWVYDEGNFDLAAWAMAMVSIIFLAVNGYQALYDTYPLTFVHGQFLGTTGNPQHAATLLAATIPSFIYMVEKQTERRLHQGFWMIALTLVMGTLILTGSRTGVLMGITAILFCYRHRVIQLWRLFVLIGVVVAIGLLVFDQSGTFQQTVSALVTGRFYNIENTRQSVWTALWRNFSTYPIFGAPLRGERFIGYGESSWLGAASALGLIGLVPLLFMGIGCLRMMFALYRLSGQDNDYFLPGSTVIAGLASLLAGSFFEAFLLSNLGFPLIALLFYLVLGHNLLTAAQERQLTPVFDSRLIDRSHQPAKQLQSRQRISH